MERASRRPALRNGKIEPFNILPLTNIAVNKLIPSCEEISPGLRCAALEGLN